MKKTLLALSVLAASGSVSAAPFYLDLGVDYNLDGSTTTSVKEEFLIKYDSTSLITDTDGSFSVSTGDAITTDAGLAVGGFDFGGLSSNSITGFDPNEVFGSFSNNGLNDDYYLSFSITNLTGSVVVTDGDDGIAGNDDDIVLPVYGSGLLEMFITFDGINYNNYMDVIVTGAGPTGNATQMTGVADFTNVDSGYNDLFHSVDYACNGNDGFYSMWNDATCGPDAITPLEINFLSSFDTNAAVTEFGLVDANATPWQFEISSNHDGSGTFSIPEPSTVALMGGSLLMLAGIARRKRKTQA